MISFCLILIRILASRRIRLFIPSRAGDRHDFRFIVIPYVEIQRFAQVPELEVVGPSIL